MDFALPTDGTPAADRRAGAAELRAGAASGPDRAVSTQRSPSAGGATGRPRRQPRVAAAGARATGPSRSGAARPGSATFPGALARLAGYTVAVASDRRRHEIADLLEADGARTVSVQAVRAYTPTEDAQLRTATELCVAQPIDELVVSSDFGFRSWMRSTRRWGLDDDLLGRFARARLLAGDPRAADSLRSVGLHEIWSTAANTPEDLFRYLFAQPIRGRRVVVQSDSMALTELCHALRDAGADVVEVPTYRVLPPAYAGLLRRLADHIVNRQVDAVVLIGAASTENLVEQAATDRRLDTVLNALTTDILPVGLSRLSAAPLASRGLRVPTPARPYLESLVDVVGANVPAHAVRVTAAGHRVEVRGQAVLVDGVLIPVQPGPIAVLRALAQHPGRVLSHADIRHATPIWANADDHAIEMAVSRLRRALEGTDLVQTVLRRGYRLAP